MAKSRKTNPYNLASVAEKHLGRNLSREEHLILELVRAIDNEGGVVEQSDDSFGCDFNEDYTDLGTAVVDASEYLTDSGIPHSLKGFTDIDDDDEDEQEEGIGEIGHTSDPNW